MRKTFLTGLIVLFFLHLSACTQNMNATPPVYQGMEISSINHQNTKRGSILPISEETIDPYIQDELNNHFGEDSNEITYFANKNEDIIINIKLYNPDGQAILRFTLNSVIYQSYQFMPGSDSENLHIQVNAGNESGIKEFTLDEIKYIENGTNETKDAIFEGERTIKLGVAFTILPSIDLSISDISITSAQFDITINDIILINDQMALEIVLFIFDEDSLVSFHQLKDETIKIEANNLLPDDQYTYIIATSIDMLDGNGSSIKILDANVFETESLLQVSDVNITTTDVSFSINASKLNSYGSVTMMSVLKDNLVVSSSSNLQNTVFTGLLSNTSYQLKIDYAYDLEDDNGLQSDFVIIDFTTVAMSEPTVDLINIDSEQTTISFELLINDTDQILHINEISLLFNNEVIEIASSLDQRQFVNLNENKEYQLRIKYEYDLNQGEGVVEKTFETSVKTKVFSQGDGTEESPYHLYTIDDFRKITLYDDLYYILMNDLDLTQTNWVPLGSIDHPFKGFLDGNSHRISHLTMTNISMLTDGWNHLGLFAAASGVIKNLILDHVMIELTASLNKSIISGSLAAYVPVEGLLISNVEISGSNRITVQVNSFSWVGGFIGFNDGPLSIENSQSTTRITNNLSRGITGGRKSGTDTYGAGGFIGGSTASLAVYNSTNMGSIGSSSDSAGLIGTSYGTIDVSNFTNVGTVYGINSSAGVVGYSTQDITMNDTTNSAAITGAGFTAGLIAYAGDYTKSVITHSSNSGQVIGQRDTAGIIGVSGKLELMNVHNSGVIIGKNYTAGIVAIVEYHYATMNKVYNVGDVSLSENPSHTSTSGILGLAYTIDLNFDQVYNEGHITGYLYAGGLVGISLGSNKMINIKNSYNKGNISAISYAAGIFGFDEGTCVVNIENTFNAGIITSDGHATSFAGRTYIITIKNSISFKGIFVNNFIASEFVNLYSLNGEDNMVNPLDSSTANSSSFYLESLTWDSNVWNFNTLNIEQENYPVLN